jgi:RNA polymerase sigma-70 factor (ECF subfamily)
MVDSPRDGSLESERGALRRRFETIERAMGALLPFFRRWAHGRLPRFARRRMDTGDVVQEAIVGVLRNLGELDGADQETLKRYLIVAIQNRICDEVRRAQIGEVTNGGTGRQPDTRPSPHEEAVEDEYQQQYRAALLQLSDDERRLLVGRIDLDLSYQELALATQRPSADAARAAARRAALHLARLMGRHALPSSAADLRAPDDDPER